PPIPMSRWSASGPMWRWASAISSSTRRAPTRSASSSSMRSACCRSSARPSAEAVGAAVMARGAAALKPSLECLAPAGIPLVQSGDDLGALISAALDAARLELQDGDVLVVAQKIVSKAEDRFVDLATVTPSSAAQKLAAEISKDPRLVEVILGES